MPPTLTAAQVAVISGKGGVGKTTVAAALAVAAADAGERVLMVDVENRESFAPLFGFTRLEYEARPLASNISGLTVLVDEALVEYLRVSYGIPRASRAFLRSRAIEFATSTAPGLRDILLIGKVREAERPRGGAVPTYDRIIVDGPPTGRLPRFLDAPRAIVELVRAGPIRRQAQTVLDMVLDPRRLQVVLVTLPEEMPVRETAEAAATLAKMGVALGPVVVNGLWPELRGLGKDPAATVTSEARAAGLDLSDEALASVARVAGAQARRARNQRAALRELAADVALPRVMLPFLFTERLARDELDTLAAELAGSGLW